MTWGELQVIVDEMLTVDADRRGTEALRARAAKNCAVDLQRYIRGFRVGHTTTYQAADLTLYTNAMLGALPSGAKPAAFYTISTKVTDGVTDDPNCRRNRMDFWPWRNRERLICGQCDERAYLYAIAPFGNQFMVHPIINDETYLLLVWEGIKSNFADGDAVPFPEDSAEAFAAYIKSRIAMVVDKNPALSQMEMALYVSKRLALYRDFQETQDAEKTDQEYTELTPLPPSMAAFGAQEVPFLRLVTKLEGLDGDYTALSAVPTTELSVPYLVDIQINGSLQRWSLESSTAATGAGYQRPNDFNDPDNANVWIQLS